MNPQLDPILREFLESALTATGCVAVAQASDGDGWHSVAGHDGKGQALSVRATFRIASVTKTFTSAAIMRLAEQGTLSLEDSIGRYLDSELVGMLSVIDGRSYGDQVSVRHLLQHTSGINAVDGADILDLLEDTLPAWALPRDARGQVEYAVQSGSPYGTPGARFHYSDTNYVLLSLILENVTGKSWPAALRDLCKFDELGLGVLHVERLEVRERIRPMMRHFVGTRDLTDIDPTFDLFGSGGIVSDCEDLAAWWHALFSERVIEGGSLKEMMKTIPDPTGGRDVGLGLFHRKYRELSVWYHSGGWGCFALHQPDARLTLVAATNQAIDTLPPGSFETLRGKLLKATIEMASDA